MVIEVTPVIPKTEIQAADEDGDDKEYPHKQGSHPVWILPIVFGSKFGFKITYCNKDEVLKPFNFENGIIFYSILLLFYSNF